jgi:hypothetical protein
MVESRLRVVHVKNNYKIKGDEGVKYLTGKRVGSLHFYSTLWLRRIHLSSISSSCCLKEILSFHTDT